MKRLLPFRLTLLLTASSLALPLPAFPQTFEPNDSIMGNYEGVWSTEDGQKGLAVVQLRSRGGGAYDGFVRLERTRKVVALFRLETTNPQPEAPLSLRGTSLPRGQSGELMPTLQATATLQAGQLSGTLSGDFGPGKFEAKRFLKSSPTEGAKPPAGAITLFDGQQTDRWESFAWQRTPDGAMEAQNANLQAKDRFPEFRLHLEFRVPFMPQATGQARGNSGVYLQSVYEVQILDSFGVMPLTMGDCGGLFGTQAPTVNACLPPAQWQTYDIIYREPTDQGRRHPTVTVIHNGITVIDQARIPADQVGLGGGGGNPDGGFLMLQYHQNPVQFRNLWVLPLRPQN